MTLPISLTCKTQEPSRTRTLRGTRGTSSGGGEAEAEAEAGGLPAWPPGQSRWASADAGAGGPPPQLAPSHAATPGCPLGLRPVRPSWDHSGSSLLPGPARPRPEQASLSAHPPACSRCPSSSICPGPPGNPRFPVVGGRGDVREGAPARSPSSPPPQPPFFLG